MVKRAQTACSNLLCKGSVFDNRPTLGDSESGFRKKKITFINLAEQGCVILSGAIQGGLDFGLTFQP